MPASDAPGRHIKRRQDLIAACLKHNVRFHETPGVLMIAFDGLGRVLNEVADDYVVLGFDSFDLEDVPWVQPRLDYITDFGEGISVAQALDAISDWPQDEALWVEAVLRPR